MHHQHGHRQMFEYEASCAAEHPFPQTGTAKGAHDRQVCY